MIDPMAGHGDLLDAAAMTARTRGFQIDRLDGIELDPDTATFCGRRITAMQEDGAVTGSRIVTGSAFDPSNVAALQAPGYDLVITNPPYVRYQSQNGDGAGLMTCAGDFPLSWTRAYQATSARSGRRSLKGTPALPISRCRPGSCLPC